MFSKWIRKAISLKHYIHSSFLDAGNAVLPMATYFKEKSLHSLHFLLRMYVYLMTLWIVPFLITYAIWCNFLNYNWPIPLLGYNYMILCITYPVGIWFIFPYELLCNNEFRTNVKMYLLDYAIRILMIFLREGIAFLFYALPPYNNGLLQLQSLFLNMLRSGCLQKWSVIWREEETRHPVSEWCYCFLDWTPFAWSSMPSFYGPWPM